MPEPTAVKFIIEKIKIANHIGEPLNKYLLVHTCTDPQMPEKTDHGLFLPGENPMMSCLVIARAADCTMDIQVGDVAYISAGDACPALPFKVNHDLFQLVQEIYVPYRIKAQNIKDIKIEGTQIKAVPVASIERSTPAAARALAEAAEGAAKGLRR